MSDTNDSGTSTEVSLFATRVGRMIDDIARGQAREIQAAGALLAQAIERGGLIHTFGTGHSHLLAEEIYSRAGGLLPVNVIESAPLMLHEDAVASGQWERLSGVAAILMEHAGVEPDRDMLIVISNSGRNAVPVEAAAWARARGMPVVAITSLAHSRAVPSLSPPDRKLYEVADVVLDNRGEPGDAAIEVTPGLRVAATSTITGAFIMQAIVLSALTQCVAGDVALPVLVSGNTEGARQRNRHTLEGYQGRLPAAYERLRARAV